MSEVASTKTKGTVKFFHDQKGYGFIERDGEDDDVFFHVSEIDALTIDEGEEVEFDTEQGDRGPRAVNVQTI